MIKQVIQNRNQQPDGLANLTEKVICENHSAIQFCLAVQPDGSMEYSYFGPTLGGSPNFHKNQAGGVEYWSIAEQVVEFGQGAHDAAVKCLKQKEPVSCAFPVSIDGADKCFETLLLPSFGHNGEVEQIIGVGIELQNGKTLPMPEPAPESFYPEILDNLGEAILVIDEDGVIRQNNKIADTIFGYTVETLVGTAVERLFGDNLQRIDQEWQLCGGFQVTRSRVGSNLVEAKRHDGSIASVEVRLFSSGDGRHANTILICRDVGERVMLQNEVNRLSYFDIATTLPNQSHFIRTLNAKILNQSDHRTNHAVVAISLGRLEFLAGTLGESTRHMVLKAAAERLLQLDLTVEVAKLDEATLVLLMALPDGEPEAETVNNLAKVKDAVEIGYTSSANSAKVAAHFGVCIFSDAISEAIELLRQSRFALNRAMRKPVGAHEIYQRDMHESAVRNLVLEHDLRRALSSSSDEFFLAFQPKVQAEGRQLIGFEALIRWKNPKRGELPPGDFVSLTEDLGLTRELTWIALENAIAQLRNWIDLGLTPVPVAVNISAADMYSWSLSEGISYLLKEYQISPSLLQCELTETGMVSDLDTARDMFESLREIGVTTAIDDFGTGYSSLQYLARLPVDILKIDRTFVMGIGENSGPTDKNVVRAIIAMAEALNVSVIAEGVETEQQFSTLTDMGCQYVQGFLFDRPLAQEFATEKLRNPAYEITGNA